MATSEDAPKPPEGAHVDIPKVSSIAGRVAVHSDPGKSLWNVVGSSLVFLMALAVVLLPLVLLFLLLRQPDTGPNGLTWVWITLMVITGALGFMVAYGMVRSVLESEA
jgi:cytochrome c biogenesis protein CcdA